MTDALLQNRRASVLGRSKPAGRQLLGGYCAFSNRTLLRPRTGALRERQPEGVAELSSRLRLLDRSDGWRKKRKGLVELAVNKLHCDHDSIESVFISEVACLLGMLKVKRVLRAG